MPPGKFSLCIRCNAGSEIGKAVQQKLPIGYLDTENWKEGGSSSAAGGTLGIPTRAPHPNAAKVFINWLLSREGQMALQKFGRPDAHNSRRIDIAKNDVDAFNRLEEGKKYFDLAKPEYQDLVADLQTRQGSAAAKVAAWEARVIAFARRFALSKRLETGLIK